MKQVFCKVFNVLVLTLLVINSSYSKNSKHLELGGALRSNYRYKAWDFNSKDVGGDAVFDVFQVNAKASYSELFHDAEYRFYSSDFGGGMLQHGYIGCEFNQNTQIHLGVSHVPFGILPFAFRSWFFNVPYCLGLEDDYNTDVRVLQLHAQRA
ncbi:MAG: hypothetical protein ACEPOZ_17565 [Marinifilaceae bacterium]